MLTIDVDTLSTVQHITELQAANFRVKRAWQLPFVFYSSGNYCVSSASNNHKAIQKTGNSCSLGWNSSDLAELPCPRASYCDSWPL